jgi:hypothetical protein
MGMVHHHYIAGRDPEAPRRHARQDPALPAAATAARARLPTRRQDQDEQLRAKAPVLDEEACKLTGIGASPPLATDTFATLESAKDFPAMRHFHPFISPGDSDLVRQDS